MAIEVATPQDLATCLREGSYRRVGIDGVDGCGKTTLAKTLAAQLKIPLISVDDYLNKKRGSYLEHLRYENLKWTFHAQSPCIMEGVCLLQVLKFAGLDIDTLVYVKRMRHGLWSDERECDIDEDVDAFLEEEKELAEMLSTSKADQSDQSSSEFPSLAEEIIRYHASYRPFENATFWYCRDDC